MSDRKSNRLILPSLIVVTLIAASAVYFLRPSESVASQALEKAQASRLGRRLQHSSPVHQHSRHGTTIQGLL